MKRTMKFENQRLTVGVSKTINTGNYESMKIHAGYSADIEDGANLDEAYTELFEECTKQILEYEAQIFGD
jgi:hypothetical protein